jgi:hypothetical protein
VRSSSISTRRRETRAINNRGNQQAISYFNFGRDGNNLLAAGDVGDGCLMRLGYTTIVDAGWEGDLGGGGPAV